MKSRISRRTLALAAVSALYLACGLALAADPAWLDGWTIRLAGMELRLLRLVGSSPPAEVVAAMWIAVGAVCGALALRRGRPPGRGLASPELRTAWSV